MSISEKTFQEVVRLKGARFFKTSLHSYTYVLYEERVYMVDAQSAKDVCARTSDACGTQMRDLLNKDIDCQEIPEQELVLML